MIEEGNQGRDSESIKDHLESVFLLKRCSSNSTVSIQVDFSHTNLDNHPSFPSPLKTLPTFNHDSNYFTPSFILGVDQLKNDEHVQIYRAIHGKKVVQISEQKSEIFVAKPSKTNSFCCVCKTHFQDYLSHLNTPKHRYLLKKSEYYTKVIEICSFFSEKRISSVSGAECKKKRGRPAKAKTIKKEFPSSKSLTLRQICEELTIQNEERNPNIA